MLSPTTSRVCKLRVRRAWASDEWRTRRAVEVGLMGSDLASGASEVLLIREVAFRVRERTLSSSPLMLGSALRDRVSALSREAMRPESGRVPPEARAVRFADLAETLAVFALSESEGRAASEWWWSSLWGNPRPGGWTSLWCAHAIEMPAAITHLKTCRELRTVVERLTPDEGARLLAAVTRAYALPHIGQIGERAGDARTSFEPQLQLTSAGEGPAYTQSTIEGERLHRELSALGAERAPALARAWVATCLAVAEQPWRARSAAFAHALASTVQRDPPLANSTPAPRATFLPEPTTRRDAVRPPDSGSSIPSLPTANAQATNTNTSNASTINDSLTHAAPPTDTPAAERPTDANQPRPALHPTTSVGARVESRSFPLANPSEGGPPALPIHESFVTSFGGVFYLANVALRLELYGDFTQPAFTGISLPFFDFLAGAGSWLLDRCGAANSSEDQQGFPSDALFAWLGRMSGRGSEQSPGHGQIPPSEFRVPEPWRTFAPALEPVSKRITSWHAWFGLVMPWIEERIRLASGEAPARWLRQRARVVRAAQRIDVHFALADHPIELRISGLDRDPGWIPAAGADFRFFYD